MIGAVAATCGVLPMLASGEVEPANAASRPPRLLVPAYFYPSGRGLQEWDRLLKAAARLPIVAVVNPASGPGERVDPNYTAVLRRAVGTGLIPIGYVTTSYSRRPIAEVKADIDRWLRLYPAIRGIFLDEQPSGPEQVAYLAEVSAYARRAKRLDLVVSNPGAVCSERYFERHAADAFCLFEGPLDGRGLELPKWTARDAGRVVVLPYRVPTADAMRNRLREAVGFGVGYLYITDADGANPWGRLPRYWDEEVAAVMEIQRARPASTPPRSREVKGSGEP